MRSLLTFSRHETVEKSPVNVVKVFNGATSILRRVLPASIQIVTNLTASEELWINADPGQVQQVLMNLTITMSEGGRLTLTLEYHTDAGPDSAPDVAGSAVLTVQDTGGGMPQSVRDHIFEPFYSTKPRGQGTGLGLAIVHGIVKDHGGDIVVDSSEKRGCRICITWPCCPPPADSSSSTTVETVNTSDGQTILLAEDNTLVRGLITDALESAGHELIVAVDGAQAIDQFDMNRAAVELAILDIDLPKRNGTSCLEHMRAQEPQLPAILISGLMSESLQAQYPNVKFLAKPFQVAELLRLVRDAPIAESRVPRVATS